MAEKQPNPSRRSFAKGVLTVAGAGSLTGCTGDSGSSENRESSDSQESDTPPADNSSDTNSSDQSDDVSDQVSQREQNIRNGIPLDGLGAYTDAVLQAEQPEPATIQQIDQMLEENQKPGELAENLAQILTTENTHSTMQYFHQQHQNQENTVVTNKNYGFTAHPGEIIEVYTVTNGNLQPQPILIDTYQGQTWETNKPGQQKPEYLAALRDDTNWTRRVPQDVQSLHGGIERGRERNGNITQKELNDYRARTLRKWSYIMFGVDDEPDVRPRDVETADAVFEAVYGEGDAEIIADLSNKYHEQDYDPDTFVEVELREDGWNFHTPENREMGDGLKGEEEKFF